MMLDPRVTSAAARQVSPSAPWIARHCGYCRWIPLLGGDPSLLAILRGQES